MDHSDNFTSYTSMDTQMFHEQICFTNYSLQSCPPSIARPISSTIFQMGTQQKEEQQEQYQEEEEEEEEEELGAMKEMMYKIAAMQPVDIDPASIRKPKRRNVKISEDPQSVAARHRRERISEKIRILQRLVPGGTKLDTASMLDEAIRYVKFLKRQIRLLQSNSFNFDVQPLGSAATVRRQYAIVGEANGGAPLCFPNEVTTD